MKKEIIESTETQALYVPPEKLPRAALSETSREVQKVSQRAISPTVSPDEPRKWICMSGRGGGDGDICTLLQGVTTAIYLRP